MHETGKYIKNKLYRIKKISRLSYKRNRYIMNYSVFVISYKMLIKHMPLILCPFEKNVDKFKFAKKAKSDLLVLVFAI